MLNNYSFPYIESISDVLPAIQGAPEFIHVRKDDYDVISYVAVDPKTTFLPIEMGKNAKIRRECRGLIFDKKGKLLRRSFHKFFNLNEMPETHVSNVDFSQSHFVLKKLDGSMITPIWIGEYWRLATKMGITDTAMEAEVFTAGKYNFPEFFHYCYQQKLTPIFEWCSRKNRIVVDYPQDDLILLALRHNNTGMYELRSREIEAAKEFDLSFVDIFSSPINNIDEFTKEISGLENEEGSVVRFADGHMLKIKLTWYIKIAKAKDLLRQEYNVAKLILKNEIDDVKPLLPENELRMLLNYQESLMEKVKEYHKNLCDCISDVVGKMDRKTFALTKNNYPSFFKSVIFSCWGDHHNSGLIMEKLLDIFVKNCQSKSKFEEFKSIYLQGVSY